MAYANSDALTFSEVTSGTIEVLTRNIRPAMIYIAVFSLLGTAIDWASTSLSMLQVEELAWLDDYLALIGTGAGILGIVFIIVTVVAQYRLWEALIQGEGYMLADQPRRYLPFVGQSILIGLGTMLGFVLLIVPGLLCMSRWAMAPALLIGEGQQAVTSMGESWESIKGNSTPIILAIIAGGLGLMLLTGMAGAGMVFSNSNPILSLIPIVLSQLSSHLGTVLMIALGTFLYGRMYNPASDVEHVFA